MGSDGSTGVGSPVATLPTTATPSPRGRGPCVATMPSDEHDQRPRHTPREPAQQQDDRDRGQPDGERGTGSCPAGTRSAGRPARGTTPTGPGPRAPSDLADDHRDRQPDDEPGHDRLGQEVRDEPQAGQAGDDEQPADDQGEGGRQREVGRRVAPAPRSATTEADITAIVELTVTLRWRLVPNTAYAVIAANAVTRPSSAGTPASAA